jgi:hypothetical protein
MRKTNCKAGGADESVEFLLGDVDPADFAPGYNTLAEEERALIRSQASNLFRWLYWTSDDMSNEAKAEALREQDLGKARVDAFVDGMDAHIAVMDLIATKDTAEERRAYRMPIPIWVAMRAYAQTGFTDINTLGDQGYVEGIRDEIQQVLSKQGYLPSDSISREALRAAARQVHVAHGEEPFDDEEETTREEDLEV